MQKVFTDIVCQLKSNHLPLSLWVGMLGCFLSYPSLAQKQMTFFKGEACCFFIDDHFSVEGKIYTITKDDQKSVKIYELKDDTAYLRYTTENENKALLLDQGKMDRFYYWIYRDRIVYFDFAGSNIKTHDFPVPLEGSDLMNNFSAFSFTGSGLLIVPEERIEPSLFFSFQSESFDTVSTTVTRNSYRLAKDSFIYFTQQQSNNRALISHNLFTDEVIKLYTDSSSRISFSIEGEGLFFRDDQNLYYTKGRVQNTYLLKAWDSDDYKVRVIPEGGGLAVLEYNSTRAAFYKFDEFGNLLDSARFETVSSSISSFILAENNDILFSSWTGLLFHYDRSVDTVIVIQDLGNNEYVLTEDKIVYLKDKAFIVYNLTDNQKDTLSSGYNIPSPYRIQSQNDSFFFVSSNPEMGKWVVSVYSRIGDEFKDIIRTGENQRGDRSQYPVVVGERLFIYNESGLPQQILLNDEFIGMQAVIAVSAAVYLNERYFVVGSDQKLYEINDQVELVGLLEDLPIDSNYAELYVFNEQLFTQYDQASDKNGYLVHLDYKNGVVTELLPPLKFDHASFSGLSSENYLLYRVHMDGEEVLWRYDLRSDSWLGLPKAIAHDRNYRHFSGHISNGFFYSVRESTSGPVLRGTKLDVAVMEELTTFQTPSADAVVKLFETCGDKTFWYYHSRELDISELWVSDGTPEGTYIIGSMDDREGFSIPYHFEGDLFYTKMDSFFTQTLQFDCLSETIMPVEWEPYYITQGLYKVEDRIYALANHRYPRRNLTIAELAGDQLIELITAPTRLGFLGDEFTGGVRRQVPVLNAGDSLLFVVAPFDDKGEEIWLITNDTGTERITDLNPGPFDSYMEHLLVFEDALYFQGYKYGPGYQIWKWDLPESTNAQEAHSDTSKNLRLFPNPAKELIRVKDMPLEQAVISVFNSNGVCVSRSTKAAGATTFTLQVEHLNAGQYFIILVSGDQLYHAKFLKMHGY